MHIEKSVRIVPFAGRLADGLRAYLLDEDGHIVDDHTFVAAGDEAALTLAYQYANGLDVEVWHRARRVGLIPREPKSIDLED